MNLAITPTRAERAHDVRPVETPGLDGAMALGQAIVENLSRVLLGRHDAITAAAVAALAGGHLLIEDVPGVGKTVLARAIAISLGTDLSRVQGHPDLLPSDVTGVSVYASDRETWEFRQGPVFAHVVLFDELNRTPPRTCLLYTSACCAASHVSGRQTGCRRASAYFPPSWRAICASLAASG